MLLFLFFLLKYKKKIFNYYFMQKKTDPLGNVPQYLKTIQKHSSIYKLVALLLEQKTPIDKIQASLNYNVDTREEIVFQKGSVAATLGDIFMAFPEATQIALSNNQFNKMYSIDTNSIDFDKALRLGRYSFLDKVLDYVFEPLENLLAFQKKKSWPQEDEDWEDYLDQGDNKDTPLNPLLARSHISSLIDSMLFTVVSFPADISQEEVDKFAVLLDKVGARLTQLNQTSLYQNFLKEQSLLEKNGKNKNSYEELQTFQDKSKTLYSPLEGKTKKEEALAANTLSSEFDISASPLHMFLAPRSRHRIGDFKNIDAKDYEWATHYLPAKILVELLWQRKVNAANPSYQNATEALVNKLLSDTRPLLSHFVQSHSLRNAANVEFSLQMKKLSDGSGLVELLWDSLRNNMDSNLINFSIHSVLFSNSRLEDIGKIENAVPKFFQNLNERAVAELYCPRKNLTNIVELPTAPEVQELTQVCPHLKAQNLFTALSKNILNDLCEEKNYKNHYSAMPRVLSAPYVERLESYLSKSASPLQLIFNSEDKTTDISLSELKLIVLSGLGYGLLDKDSVSKLLRPAVQSFLFSYDFNEVSLEKIKPILEQVYVRTFLAEQHKLKDREFVEKNKEMCAVLSSLPVAVKKAEDLKPEMFEKMLLSLELAHKNLSPSLKPTFKV